MSENFNPYETPQRGFDAAERNPYAAPVREQQTEQPAGAFDTRQQTNAGFPPQPPFNARETAPQPPMAPVRQPYPQQSFTNQPVRQKRDSRGAARAFGMVSFIIGCFVLPVTAMIFFNFRSSVSDKFSAALSFSLFLSIPALVFGVISLMKKTDKWIFPVLGISFAAVLMLCAFITYFFMVNTAPVSSFNY